VLRRPRPKCKPTCHIAAAPNLLKGTLTQLEMEPLTMMPDLPQTEIAIVELTNAFRAEQKLGPVKPNPTLAKAAKAFAEYLATNRVFGHTVDGRRPADRTKIAGYKHCIVAENLAMNQDSRGFETKALANQAVTGWKNSPPHRAAMLNPNVTEIGVGIAKGPETADKYLSVQLFGRPDSLQFVFKVENRAGIAAAYSFSGERVDVPNNTVITQTACTPEPLVFDGVTGAFPITNGNVYRLTRGAAGKLQVDVTK
jgi:uncharacterized protein YkwD